MEQGLAIRRVGQDVFEAVNEPWCWPPHCTVVPGGILMALAAHAAYETLTRDFVLDSVHTHFLVGPRPDRPLRQMVSRLSDGGRFASRAVTVEQDGKIVVHVTCTFVRLKAMAGPSMAHAPRRRTSQKIDQITLDDLAGDGHSRYMQFQRLSVTCVSPKQDVTTSRPEDLVHLVAARISPALSSRDPRMYALGILCLSDYHVLDGAPIVHGLSVGQFRMNDQSRTPSDSHIDRMTSVQHSVRFHALTDIAADSMCYIEVSVPWANSRRAEMQTRIFDSSDRLLATCSQLAYYVLKEQDQDGSSHKL